MYYLVIQDLILEWIDKGICDVCMDMKMFSKIRCLKGFFNLVEIFYMCFKFIYMLVYVLLFMNFNIVLCFNFWVFFCFCLV